MNAISVQTVAVMAIAAAKDAEWEQGTRQIDDSCGKIIKKQVEITIVDYSKLSLPKIIER